MRPPRSGQLKRLPPFQSPLTAIRKSLQKPSNVDVPVSYQPPCSHRRLAGDSRRRERLLVDRPAVADRRTAEAGGDRKTNGAAPVQARADAVGDMRTPEFGGHQKSNGTARLKAGADADAETGNRVLQRQFAVAQR